MNLTIFPWQDVGAIGSCLIAFVSLIITLSKYLELKRKEALEAELKNLRDAFDLFENSKNLYKNLTLQYPESLCATLSLALLPAKGRGIYSIDTNLSLYDNFYLYLKKACDSIPGSELTYMQMITLYNIYVENLIKRDKLDQTFQILYSCIHDIVSHRTSSYCSKRKQIKHVQNCMTSKQALMYLFNQIHYAGRQRCYNEYLDELRRYDFFSKMLESQEYRDIENWIPVYVEQQFTRLM